MREGLLIGLLYAAVGGLVTAIAAQYAGPRFWEIFQWTCVGLILGCVTSLWLLNSHQTTGRPFWMPAACINLGLCLIVIGWLWHISKEPIATNEYLYFDVDLAAGTNTGGGYPGRIFNLAPSTFSNVIAWFSPEAGKGIADPQNESNPYWSLRYLQVGMPILHSGGPRTGKFIPAGYYFVQCNATYKDISYYFRELLEIREYNGSVIQLIDVWRTTPATGELVKVYTSDRPAELRDNREPF
jgi:hypothetical protein